jgi:hypothetical protein
MVAQDSNSYFMIVTRLKFLIIYCNYDRTQGLNYCIYSMAGFKASTIWQWQTLGLNYRKVAQNMYTYTDPLIQSCARHSDKDSKLNSSAQKLFKFNKPPDLFIFPPISLSYKLLVRKSAICSSCSLWSLAI